MPPTRSVAKLLKNNGFNPHLLNIWSCGVDQRVFYPRERDELKFPKKDGGPIIMYVGRVSLEKNIEAFLALALPNSTKYVVGDGPEVSRLKIRYPEVLFLGHQEGGNLAAAYSNADVIVFPSQTDTFGNVITEALACGTPVAAFEAPGPIDIIKPNFYIGSVNDDLKTAIRDAYLYGIADECVSYVTKHYTWEVATRQFIDNLVPVDQHWNYPHNFNSHSGKMQSLVLFALTCIYIVKRWAHISPIVQYYSAMISHHCKLAQYLPGYAQGFGQRGRWATTRGHEPVQQQCIGQNKQGRLINRKYRQRQLSHGPGIV